MQFNSYEFILFFLPLTLLLYFLANKIKPILGKAVLIAAGVLFYSWGRMNMLAYLGVSVFINYTAALLIRRFSGKNKWLRAIPIAVNAGALLYFKYYGFAVENIDLLFGTDLPFKDVVLPLGISFYTFQQIAYIAAVEKGELENVSLTDYLTYILYFPKLIMGPITDPVSFISQINQEHRKKADADSIAAGIRTFSLGLIKKVLLADTFAKAVLWIDANMDAATAMDCLLLILFCSFEIYFDFSGYSDMAVGISLMFRIDLPMNFDSPYKALSVREFWKRWHISLTRFFTKYVYVPLGGSRKGRAFTCLNIMIVFLISGLWHGAGWTFILWGVLHGVLVCFDRIFEKWEEKIFVPVRWLCTFGAVGVLWLLFNAETVGQWKDVLCKIAFMQSTAVSEGVIASFGLAEDSFLRHLPGLQYLQTNVRGFNMLAFLLVSCIVCFIPENNYRKKESLSVASMLLTAIAFIWGILCLGTESAFVYFGF